jgi:hypothetical protein
MVTRHTPHLLPLLTVHHSTLPLSMSSTAVEPAQATCFTFWPSTAA